MVNKINALAVILVYILPIWCVTFSGDGVIQSANSASALMELLSVRGCPNRTIVFEEEVNSMRYKYVIIGNSAAAVGAVEAVRRNDKGAELQ